MNVVAEVATDTADRRSVIRPANCHDDENPRKTASKYSHNPRAKAGEDDYPCVVVPIYGRMSEMLS